MPSGSYCMSSSAGARTATDALCALRRRGDSASDESAVPERDATPAAPLDRMTQIAERSTSIPGGGARATREEQSGPREERRHRACVPGWVMWRVACLCDWKDRERARVVGPGDHRSEDGWLLCFSSV